MVNFAVLPQYQRDLKNLKLVWQHVKLVQDEQRGWKMKQWQRIDTKHLHNGIAKQKDMLHSLPSEVGSLWGREKSFLKVARSFKSDTVDATY